MGGLWVSLPPQFDANLLKLQADGLPSVREVRKLPSWYAVVISQDLDQLRRAREAFAPRPGDDEKIDRTESVLDAMEKQTWLAANNADLKKVNWREPPSPAVADLRTRSPMPPSHSSPNGKSSPTPATWPQLRNPSPNFAQHSKPPPRPSQRSTRPARPPQRLATRLPHPTPRPISPNSRRPPLNLETLPPELRDHFVSFIAALPITTTFQNCSEHSDYSTREQRPPTPSTSTPKPIFGRPANLKNSSTKSNSAPPPTSPSPASPPSFTTPPK